MLEVVDLKVNYGAAPALWGVSLDVQPGELVCVVGPNGAGKSTLINVIAGLHRGDTFAHALHHAATSTTSKKKKKSRRHGGKKQRTQHTT